MTLVLNRVFFGVWFWGILMFVSTVDDLDKGKEYEFRVVAKNIVGLGEPGPPSKSVVTQPKPSRNSVYFQASLQNYLFIYLCCDFVSQM